MPFPKGYVPKGGPKAPQTRNVKIRTKDGGLVEVTLTRSQAIKAMCTECCGFGEFHPRECSDVNCPLHGFRGKINLAYQDGEDSGEDSQDEVED